MRTEEFISPIAQINRSVQLLAPSPFSGEMTTKNSLSSLIADNIRSTCAPLGDRHSNVKSGFWRNKVPSQVEPGIDNPDLKWAFTDLPLEWGL